VEPVKNWLNTARRPDIVRRSLRVAALVGTILVAINYWDRILTSTLAPGDYIKMVMTYFVPYAVCTYSCVSAVKSDKS
jgi:hypothetical protein